MRQKITVVILVLILLTIPSMTFANSNSIYITQFKDLNNHWAKEYVSEFTSLKIIEGYSDGTFKPDNTISVAEFIKIITSAMNKDIKAGEGSNWHVPYVNESIKMNLVKGGEFTDYNQEITRGEIAKIISRALEEEPKNINELKHQVTDFNKIPSEYQSHVAKVCAAGIINGYPDGSFKYDRTAKRAEASVMLLKLLNADERKIPEIKEEKPYNELSNYKSVPLKNASMLKNAEFTLDRWGNPEDVENVYFLKKSDLPIRIGNVVIEDIEFGMSPYDWESIFVSGYVLDGKMGTATISTGLIFRNETYLHKTFAGFRQDFHNALVGKYPNMKGLRDNGKNLSTTNAGEKFTYIASFGREGRFDYKDYNFNDLTHIAFYHYYDGKNVIVFENFFK